MSDIQTPDIQERFLDDLIKHKNVAAIYLKSGIKLHGTIIGYDQYTISLKENATQLVFKHAIATIVPLKDTGN